MLAAEIWRRRVPHVCAAWLGAVWAATEVTAFAVTRYALADAWIDRILFGGLLLTLVVAYAAWRIGAEGKVRWRLADGLVGVAGLSIALALAHWFTADRNEESAHHVAAAATVKQPLLLIGEFRAASTAADAELEPMAHALSLLLELDLQYGRGFYASSLPTMGQSGPITLLRNLGFEDWRNADAGAWRSAARSYHFDALVMGELNHTQGQWQLTVERIRWLPEESREKKQYQSASSSELVDLAAADIRTWLSPSEVSADPSLESISAESESTRIKYAQASALIDLENQPEEGLRRLDEVLAESPAFAMAEMRKLSAQVKLAQREAMLKTLASLNRKLTQLPTRQRFQVQIMGAQLRNDAAEISTIYELWLQEDPSAREPRSALAEQRFLEHGDLEALQEMAEIAKSEANSRALLRVAGVYDWQDMDEQADALRSLALARDGNDLAAIMAQAQAFEYRGAFDEALKLWRKARLLNPNVRQPSVAMARIQFAQGDYEGALRAAAEVTAQATHRDSRLAAVLEQSDYLYRLGRYAETRKKMEELRANEYEALDPAQRSASIDGPLANAIAITEGPPAAEAYLQQNINLAEPEMRDWTRDNLALEAARYAGDFERAHQLSLAMQERAKSYSRTSETWFAAVATFMAFTQGKAGLAELTSSDALILDYVKRGQLQRARHQQLRMQVAPAMLAANATEQVQDWLSLVLRPSPKDPEANLLMAFIEWQDGKRLQAKARVKALQNVLQKADEHSHLRRIEARLDALPGWTETAATP